MMRKKTVLCRKGYFDEIRAVSSGTFLRPRWCFEDLKYYFLTLIAFYTQIGAVDLVSCVETLHYFFLPKIVIFRIQC